MFPRLTVALHRALCAMTLLLFVGLASEPLRAAPVRPEDEKEEGREGFPEGARAKVLAASLAGTKWFWHGKRNRVLEFRQDGVFALADWEQQGITATWKATGPDWVTVTVTSKKFRNLTANLVFSKDRTFFTGTDLDWNRQIEKSPRAVENAPRPPQPQPLGRKRIFAL